MALFTDAETNKTQAGRMWKQKAQYGIWRTMQRVRVPSQHRNSQAQNEASRATAQSLYNWIRRARTEAGETDRQNKHALRVCAGRVRAADCQPEIAEGKLRISEGTAPEASAQHTRTITVAGLGLQDLGFAAKGILMYAEG